MSNELTEEHLLKVIEDIKDIENPDTIMISEQRLEELKERGMVRYNRVKCSWELIATEPKGDK